MRSEDAEAKYIWSNPVKFRKVNREIKILMALSGHHNCIKLLDIVKEGEVFCLVMEHVAASEYRKLL